jgi:tRNA 2-thiouridine synthesizing protein A
MSRGSWLGRSTGRHAAPSRGRNARDKGAADAGARTAPPAEPAPPEYGASAPMLGAPTVADAPLVSPVTDAARAASAAAAAGLPNFVPAGAEPVITLDALGRKCPIPIIMLADQIRNAPVGSVVAVLADDPAAYTDIPAWCALKSHDCVFRASYATGWSFGVRRRY